MHILEQIKRQVTDNPVIIYMKGTPQLPKCGFSANAVRALESTGVPYAYVDILNNPRLQEALPAFSDWPTFPQIYIKGELIGGGDIVVELARDGSLKTMMQTAMAAS